MLNKMINQTFTSTPWCPPILQGTDYVIPMYCQIVLRRIKNIDFGNGRAEIDYAFKIIYNFESVPAEITKEFTTKPDIPFRIGAAGTFSIKDVVIKSRGS